MIGFLVYSIKLRLIKRNPKLKKQLLLDEKLRNKMSHIVRFKQFFYQFFMWFCMFNLTYFVTCTVLFFKQGTITHISSLALLATQAAIFVYMILKFVCNPYNFKYFWNSFKVRRLAMNHYLVYILLISSSVVLLGIM